MKTSHNIFSYRTQIGRLVGKCVKIDTVIAGMNNRDPTVLQTSLNRGLVVVCTENPL